PPAPKYAAEFSRTTMVVASPVMPSSSFMYILLSFHFSDFNTIQQRFAGVVILWTTGTWGKTSYRFCPSSVVE
ncbi:MAG: hypothetical protein ACJ795_26355, partial [Ktedonobacteraceae bacterium]